MCATCHVSRPHRPTARAPSLSHPAPPGECGRNVHPAPADAAGGRAAGVAHAVGIVAPLPVRQPRQIAPRLRLASARAVHTPAHPGWPRPATGRSGLAAAARRRGAAPVCRLHARSHAPRRRLLRQAAASIATCRRYGRRRRPAASAEPHGRGVCDELAPRVRSVHSRSRPQNRRRSRDRWSAPRQNARSCWRRAPCCCRLW